MATPLKHLLIVLLLLSILAPALAGTTMSNAPERARAVLRWSTGPIKIAVSSSLLKQSSNVKSDSDVAGAIQRSLSRWSNASNIEFQQSISEKQNVSPSGNFGDGISLITIAPTPENLLLFSKNSQETAATTRVFFDRKGYITEADIVLNPYQQFSTDGTFGTFDLESTLTHEIGHFLGLDHSPVLSATMHDNYGKNGVLGLQNFIPRTLSEIDIAAIRAKYGANRDDSVDCCGSISGKILNSSGRAIKGLQVWAEDADSGKLFAEASTGTEGGFRFDGIPAGNYNIYAQQPAKLEISLSAQDLGRVVVESGNTTAFAKRLTGHTSDLDLQYLGFNGQLSGLAVPLNAGRSYTLYLGGKNINKDISIGFSSPFLKISPKTMAKVDFGDDISAVSFEVQVDPLAPIGEYSIFVESKGQSRSVIIGGIAVRGFANPFSNFVLSDN